MKKNISTIIWTLAIIMLVIAAFTVYNKYKPLAEDLKGNEQNETSSLTDKSDDSINEAGSESTQSESTVEKLMAPDFILKDLQGNNVKLSDYKGKIVILNFWATWCGYCKDEMPEFSQYDKQLQQEKDAVILAIDSEESEAKVKKFVSDNNIDLKVLLDVDGEVTKLYAPYGIQGFPTTFFINSDGSFYTYIPGATNKDTLEMVVEKMRKGEPVR